MSKQEMPTAEELNVGQEQKELIKKEYAELPGRETERKISNGEIDPRDYSYGVLYRLKNLEGEVVYQAMQERDMNGAMEVYRKSEVETAINILQREKSKDPSKAVLINFNLPSRGGKSMFIFCPDKDSRFYPSGLSNKLKHSQYIKTIDDQEKFLKELKSDTKIILFDEFDVLPEDEQVKTLKYCQEKNIDVMLSYGGEDSNKARKEKADKLSKEIKTEIHNIEGSLKPLGPGQIKEQFNKLSDKNIENLIQASEDFPVFGDMNLELEVEENEILSTEQWKKKLVKMYSAKWYDRYLEQIEDKGMQVGYLW